LKQVRVDRRTIRLQNRYESAHRGLQGHDVRFFCAPPLSAFCPVRLVCVSVLISPYVTSRGLSYGRLGEVGVWSLMSSAPPIVSPIDRPATGNPTAGGRDPR